MFCVVSLIAGYTVYAFCQCYCTDHSSQLSNSLAFRYNAIIWLCETFVLLLAGLVTLTEMKAKQEDIVKERERQIVTNKPGEAHLNIDEAGMKTKHCPTKQVTDFVIR